MTVTTINPATGKPLADYAETDDSDIDEILQRAHDAATQLRRSSPSQRAENLRSLATALRAHRDELALLATQEMGKPLAESRAEVEKCATTCDWFADHAPDMLEPESIDTGAVRSQIVYTPLGLVFAIMPWNFPYWQAIRAFVPAYAAGNTMVVKHAPSTTGSALRLAEVAAAAGFPADTFSVIVAGYDATPAISQRVIADERVAAVTLTGSTGAGRAVAAIAGKALKKTVLELGGSDPFIVLNDADIEAAAKTAVRSRFQNSGQSCIATKRIIVESSVARDFTERLVSLVSELNVGDPTDPEVNVGPLAREDLLESLERQVTTSVYEGATLLTGGRRIERPGFFFEPTVLAVSTEDVPVMTEEVFGPAVPVSTVPDAEAAITLANKTNFGLGSNIWTADLARGEELARQIDAGHTAVNGMTASDPRLPFGGVKDSGFGRELYRHGLHEFVNVHALVVEGAHGPKGQAQANVE